MNFDVTFDFWSETREEGDPDAESPTLRGYHRLLWSKPLPSGRLFELRDSESGHYLYHRSDLSVLPLERHASSYLQMEQQNKVSDTGNGTGIVSQNCVHDRGNDGIPAKSDRWQVDD